MDSGDRPPPRVLAIVGPTASGKSKLSIPLAEALDGEIISTDSRQVYRGMDVGTDKVGREERERIPHHGLDLVDPDERYSAGRFARDARRWIEEIEDMGRVPLLVGGTGFFLRAVVEPLFREPPLDHGRREALRRYLRARPVDELVRWVRKLDPLRAESVAAGGRQRLSRALEVALLTGRSLSWWHVNAPADAPAVPAMVVQLQLPRGELYRRIDERVERMFEAGFPAEVRALLEAGYAPDDPGMTGTGYREVTEWLRGGISREEAVRRIQGATRAYARRQLTWFRNQLPADTVEVDARRPVEKAVEEVLAQWEHRRSVGGVRGMGPGIEAGRSPDSPRS